MNQNVRQDAQNAFLAEDEADLREGLVLGFEAFKAGGSRGDGGRLGLILSLSAVLQFLARRLSAEEEHLQEPIRYVTDALIDLVVTGRVRPALQPTRSGNSHSLEMIYFKARCLLASDLTRELESLTIPEADRIVWVEVEPGARIFGLHQRIHSAANRCEDSIIASWRAALRRESHSDGPIKYLQSAMDAELWEADPARCGHLQFPPPRREIQVVLNHILAKCRPDHLSHIGQADIHPD